MFVDLGLRKVHPALCEGTERGLVDDRCRAGGAHEASSSLPALSFVSTCSRYWSTLTGRSESPAAGASSPVHPTWRERRREVSAAVRSTGRARIHSTVMSTGR